MFLLWECNISIKYPPCVVVCPGEWGQRTEHTGGPETRDAALPDAFLPRPRLAPPVYCQQGRRQHAHRHPAQVAPEVQQVRPH